MARTHTPFTNVKHDEWPMAETHATTTPSSSGDAAERDQIVAALAGLTLPLMWSLRQRSRQVFEPFGMRPTRVLLMELVDRGIDSPSQIAEVLEAVPPAVTAIVNELIELRWLAREADPNDRRRVHLRLTPDGLDALQRMRAAWTEATRRDIERLDLDDVRAVLRVFTQLLEAQP